MTDDLWGRFEARRDYLRGWLKLHYAEVFTDQKHCEEGTSERAYWHHGYMMGINDILKALTNDEGE